MTRLIVLLIALNQVRDAIRHILQEEILWKEIPPDEKLLELYQLARKYLGEHDLRDSMIYLLSLYHPPSMTVEVKETLRRLEELYLEQESTKTNGEIIH